MTVSKVGGVCDGVECAGFGFHQPEVQPEVKEKVGHSVLDLWKCYPSLQTESLIW